MHVGEGASRLSKAGRSIGRSLFAKSERGPGLLVLTIGGIIALSDCSCFLGQLSP
jgi:hypothetical protein